MTVTICQQRVDFCLKFRFFGFVSNGVVEKVDQKVKLFPIEIELIEIAVLSLFYLSLVLFVGIGIEHARSFYGDFVEVVFGI